MNFRNLHVVTIFAACTLPCEGSLCHEGFATSSCSGPVATCSSSGGKFTFTGCTAKPKCTASATAGYTLTNCDTASVQCTVTCATDWSGSAKAECARDGAAFSFSGCEKTCTWPTKDQDSNVANYISSFCSTSAKKTAAQCATKCAPGFRGTPSATCATAGGYFILADCTAKPKCTAPSSVAAAYTVTSCDTASAAIRADQCTVACSENYATSSSTSSATVTCASSGSKFEFTGCDEKKCTWPTKDQDSNVANYISSLCSTSAKKTAAQCATKCAPGFGGTPSATCATAGGYFTLAGCDTAIPTCTLPASYTGYIVSGCNALTEAKRADQCSLSCDSASHFEATSSALTACTSSCTQYVGSSQCQSGSNKLMEVKRCSSTKGTADRSVMKAHSTMGFVLPLLLLGLASYTP